MSKPFQAFEQRKQDHIQLAMMPENQAAECHDLDGIRFYHDALPDLDLQTIDMSSERFSEPVACPFFVSSMTAGHAQATVINYRLMEACAQKGWAMGVGSQRRELSDDTAKKEWASVRQDFPELALFGNLGIAQLIDTPIEKIQALMEALHAQAMIIHCNPLQESIQPEGTPQFKGAWKALEALVRQLEAPVIVKETGCGFQADTMQRLSNIGVAAIDVAGLGGTHWGRIEGHRAEETSIYHAAAQTFRNWGMTTLECLLQAQHLRMDAELWGSGGVRHGLDAAKLLALGAQSIGFAKPMMETALESTEAIVHKMEQVEYELKVAMFCTGSAKIADLQDKLCL